MARCTSSYWKYHLVLLGIRTMPKDGLQVSAAEMVYGQPLVVPEQFFPSPLNNNKTQSAELQAARWSAQQFTPCRPTHHNYRELYTPQGLFMADHVFICQDLVEPALSPPYKGPYRVLKRTNKAYKLDMSDRIDWISIGRHIESVMYTPHCQFQLISQ